MKVALSVESRHLSQSQTKYQSASSSLLLGWPRLAGTYWMVISSPAEISRLARTRTNLAGSELTGMEYRYQDIRLSELERNLHSEH